MYNFILLIVSQFLTKREYANTFALVSKQFSKFDKFAQDQLPDGVISTEKEIITYKQGKKHGLYESYEHYELSYRMNYFNGRLYGNLVFFDNGILRCDINYKNDKPHGPYTYYYDNGNIEDKKHFIDGNLTGLVESYYNNGNIFSRKQYNNGVLETSIRYDEYGNMLKNNL